MTCNRSEGFCFYQDYYNMEMSSCRWSLVTQMDAFFSYCLAKMVYSFSVLKFLQILNIYVLAVPQEKTRHQKIKNSITKKLFSFVDGSKKVVPFCSTVYFPIVIEMFVSKRDIFHFFREVHSDAVIMHCRTTFFEPSKKVKCLFVIEFLIFLCLVFSYATART